MIILKSVLTCGGSPGRGYPRPSRVKRCPYSAVGLRGLLAFKWSEGAICCRGGSGDGRFVVPKGLTKYVNKVRTVGTVWRREIQIWKGRKLE